MRRRNAELIYIEQPHNVPNGCHMDRIADARGPSAVTLTLGKQIASARHMPIHQLSKCLTHLSVVFIDRVGLALSLDYPHIHTLFNATSVSQIERIAVMPMQDQPARCTPDPVVGLGVALSAKLSFCMRAAQRFVCGPPVPQGQMGFQRQ